MRNLGNIIVDKDGFVIAIQEEYSGNGYIYKNMDNFDNEEGICYISEYGIEEFNDAIAEGKKLTEQDIVELGIGVDYKSCLEMLDNFLRDYGVRTENAVLKQVAESILCSCDWQYFSTELDQQYIEDLEEWIISLEQEIDNSSN